MGCGLEYEPNQLIGDVAYPTNEGKVCSKGVSELISIDTETRLLRPYIRSDITQALEKTSWEEAIAKIASTIQKTPKDKIGFYLSGQLLTEDYYIANKLAKGFLGTNNIDTNSRTCMASAVVGYKKSIGADFVPLRMEDIFASDLLILTGANTAEAHVVFHNNIKKAKKKGLKVVVIDPRFTDTAKSADLYLPIKPGSDIDFFNLLSKRLIDEEKYNKNFVAKHVNNFELLKNKFKRAPVTKMLERSKKINKIEKLKETKTPMEVYNKLDEICANGLENLEEGDSGFFLKCFGAFLKKDGKFMLRVRIPAGQMSMEQARKIGELSKAYGDDYIDISTRQQVELRYIELENLGKVLKGLNDVGISTFQTGVDNFRNIVTSSFDGLGEKSLIETKPIIDALQSIFLNKEEWIGTLPRKFNTGILGNSINDCNIYGHDACFIIAKKEDEIGFNLYLGGRVGVQARDTGLFLTRDQVVPTFTAVINLFKKYGFRDNRNKNRLHFLLEAVGMDAFVDAIKESSGLSYQSAGEILAKEEYQLNEEGIFDLSTKLKAVHISIPSGIFSGNCFLEVAALAKEHTAQIRLSVEQSLYLIVEKKQVKDVKKSMLFDIYKKYHNTYYNHQIACAGTATCAFGVIPNKPDAIEMANFLQKEVPIVGGKVRMYWSACPKGCGIHGVADIGFEGCKAKDDEGNKVDGVHILIGGKATQEAKEARVIFKSLPIPVAQQKVKSLMEIYRDESLENETFESFDTRVLSHLSTLFCFVKYFQEIHLS